MFYSWLTAEKESVGTMHCNNVRNLSWQSITWLVRYHIFYVSLYIIVWTMWHILETRSVNVRHDLLLAWPNTHNYYFLRDLSTSPFIDIFSNENQQICLSECWRKMLRWKMPCQSVIERSTLLKLHCLAPKVKEILMKSCHLISNISRLGHIFPHASCVVQRTKLQTFTGQK